MNNDYSQHFEKVIIFELLEDSEKIFFSLSWLSVGIFFLNLINAYTVHNFRIEI